MDQLGCVPPKRMEGSTFMVGKAYDYDYDKRDVIYSVYVQVNNRYFCRLGLYKGFNPRMYASEVKNQFNIK